MADLIGPKTGFEQSVSPAAPHARDLKTPVPATGGQVTPSSSDTGMTALDRLLSRPGLDDMLMQALRPRGVGAELLRPSIFFDTLQRTRVELRQRGTSRPKDRQSMDNAADLLDDEIKLQELLSMYRNALFHG